MIVFLVLIYAGFRYYTSFGNPAAHKDAKDWISSAFLGLAILLGSYLILTTINPQLVFLKLPTREVFFPQPIATTTIAENVLGYTEWPLGGLVGDMFSSERVQRIESVLAGTLVAASDVKTISQALMPPVVSSSCGFTSPGCASGCQGGVCSGNPCPQRGTIEQKRSELQSAINTLNQWMEKVKVEINGSDAEKIIGLKRELDDAQKTEEEIKKCPLGASANGKPQMLLNSNDFSEYRQYLKEAHKIEKTDLTQPVAYILTDNPYSLMNFYCTETIYPVSPASIPEFSLTDINIEGTQETAACGEEISIGQTFDNSQDLTQRIINSLQEVINAVQNEINIAQNLYQITNPEGRCTASNCRPAAPCSEFCGACPPPEGEGGSFDPFLVQEVFAQADCCPYICYPARSPCLGVIFDNATVESLVSQIQEALSKVNSFTKASKDLLEERGIEDRLKISNILTGLKANQREISACYNIKETQLKAESGEEKVLWKELQSCSSVKQAAEQGFPFDDSQGKELGECYGASSGSMDNFFCCETELF